jgi:hypothetical protein
MNSNISNGQAIEVKSNLELEWMSPETRVSHCALNQISYILLQMKEELQRLDYY